jgi:hypothetical protein
MWSGANNDRVYAVTTGWHIVQAEFDLVEYVSEHTRIIFFEVFNASNVSQGLAGFNRYRVVDNGATSHSVPIHLTAGWYIKVGIYHNNGSTRNITAARKIRMIAQTASDASQEWGLAVDIPLTTLTGLTRNGGSWAITSGQVELNGSWCRAAADTPLTEPFFAVIIECEVDVAADSKIRQVMLTDSAAGGAGLSFRIDGNSSCRVERDGVASYGAQSITALSSGWHKLRLVVLGNRILGYIDGTLRTAHWGDTDTILPNARYAGFGVFGGTTQFRNFKAWVKVDSLPA